MAEVPTSDSQVASDAMGSRTEELPYNSVLHKIVQGLRYTERAWASDEPGQSHMRLTGRPETWVDINWQQETHTVALAFRVLAPGCSTMKRRCTCSMY